MLRIKRAVSIGDADNATLRLDQTIAACMPRPLPSSRHPGFVRETAAREGPAAAYRTSSSGRQVQPPRFIRGWTE